MRSEFASVLGQNKSAEGLCFHHMSILELCGVCCMKANRTEMFDCKVASSKL